jgi:hypothetical protein
MSVIEIDLVVKRIKTKGWVEKVELMGTDGKERMKIMKV